MKKNTKEKKLISRQTSNKICVISFAAFLVSNIFSLLMDVWINDETASEAVLNVSLLLQLVLTFAACGLLLWTVHLDHSPRVEKKDELYIQHQQTANSNTITAILSILLCIGVLGDTIGDNWRVLVNSKTCFIAYSIVGLISSLNLLILDRNSKSDDNEEA